MTKDPAPRNPSIMRFCIATRNGIESNNFTRHAIGYVIRGRKVVYYGDTGYEIKAGDIFYLATGIHYIENIPESGKPFEQIIAYFKPEELNDILTSLVINYGFDLASDHQCPRCSKKAHAAYPAWNYMNTFFSALNQYTKDGLFYRDGTAEKLEMTGLIYHIISNPDCCIKRKILDNADSHKEGFEQIINKAIFRDISIEELAQTCNRSLTSFKKEFKKHFYEPPHKWFIRQRLMHSRLLLISTGKSIAEIGIECNLPNTSHFIKLFKKEYGLTPSAYRNRHINGYDGTEKEDKTHGTPQKKQLVENIDRR